MMVRAGLVAALVLISAEARACPITLALYADPEAKTELRIRTPAPWEGGGMATFAIELQLSDGRVLWGDISQNMGTSRDVGRLYSGCARPDPEDEPLSDEAAAECMVWEGVVYGLDGDTVTALPDREGKAPESLILSDLGRKLRYAVYTGPGQEPWDQYRLHGCAE